MAMIANSVQNEELNAEWHSQVATMYNDEKEWEEKVKRSIEKMEAKFCVDKVEKIEEEAAQNSSTTLEAYPKCEWYEKLFISDRWLVLLSSHFSVIH